jgi:hypothetical protein
LSAKRRSASLNHAHIAALTDGAAGGPPFRHGAG